MVECHDQALFWQCRADQAVNSEDAAQRDTAKQEQYLAWVDGNMKQFRGNLATLKELITQIEELS